METWTLFESWKYFISKQSERIIKNNAKLENFGDCGFLTYDSMSARESLTESLTGLMSLDLSQLTSLGFSLENPRNVYKGKGRYLGCHTPCTYSLGFSPKQLSQQKTQELDQAELTLWTGTKGPHPMTFSKSGRARSHSHRRHLQRCAPAVGC